MLVTKLKGIGLVIGTSLVVVSGAVAFGQGGGGVVGQQADGERMIIMERKLDRIIDALDRMAGAGGSPDAPRGSGPSGEVRQSLWREEAKAAPSGPNTAIAAATSTNYVRTLSLDDRVESLEQNMRQVQSLLKQLVGRVSELERAGQGDHRAPQSPERAK